MAVVLKNNAVGYLSTAISASDVGLALVAGDGVNFPSLSVGEYFYATIVATNGEYEIVKVTARVSDTLTVLRAQDNSTAYSFAAGAKIEMRVNVATVEDAVTDLVATSIASSLIASAISIVDTGGYYAATNVEAALQEVTAANKIRVADAGNFYAATNVEAALQEITAANKINITDAGNYYTGTTVEAALQEAAVASNMDIVDAGSYYVGTNVEAALQEAAQAATIRITDPGNYYASATVDGALQEAAQATTTKITDAGSYYISTNVEGALQEIGVRLTQGDRRSVTDYGAVGNGVTDDTAAIQAAFNDSSDKEIFFPAGTYICGSVNITNQCRAIGEGADATFIKASGATVNVWTVQTQARFDVENMTFSPASETVNQSSGAYLTYNPTSGYNFGSRIRNCIFVRSNIGIYFIDAAGWSIEDCYFPLYTTAVAVKNVDTPDAGDSTIRASVFDGGGITGTAILQNSSGGLRIINNKILHGAYGYIGGFDSSPSMTSILLIQCNSIETQNVAAVAFNSSNNTTFGQVLIEGNQFTVKDNAVGIRVEDPGYDFLDSVNISDNLFNLGNSSTGFYIDRGSRITLLPNTFYGNGTNETGIFIGGNVDSVVFYPQVLLDGTTGLAGTLTNVIFYAGLSLAGTVSTTTGTAYGSMYISAEQVVTFFVAFPVAPKVMATIEGLSGGGVSVAVYNVTASSFKMKIIGLNNGGSVSAKWFATV